mmetsp:Transcript_42414/g.128185  ORF Transcript_42414/g.128185 Transcript_42414/m.128185 type:complete len:271 (+) Transcript_42414:3977-4789(+)
MAHEPRDAITAIPIARGLPQYPPDVELFGDEAETRLRIMARRRMLREEVVVFLVEEVSNLLKQHDGVGQLPRVLPELDQAGEQVLVVGDVEVPRQDQIPGHPIALPHDRVAPVQAVLAVGAVPHVGQQGLAAEGHVVAHPIRVRDGGAAPGHLGSVLDLLHRSLLHALKHVLDGVGRNGLLAMNVLRAWRDIQRDARHPGAVLASVPLLFHEHVHAVHAEELRAVLLQVVLGGLEQAHECEAALMADVLRHSCAAGEGGVGAARRLLVGW